MIRNSSRLIRLSVLFTILSFINCGAALTNSSNKCPVLLYSSSPYEIGDEIEDFGLRNIDGNIVSLGDFKGVKGFIVVFTSNHCPFSKVYENRLKALHSKYVDLGFPLLAINPNDPNAYEEDNFENMQKRSREKAFSFPYLLDESGIAIDFNAVRTPQAFVIEKVGEKFFLRYIGSIDDNAQDASFVNKKYVEAAIDNLLSKKPVVTQATKPIGCSIKWRADL